MGIFKRKEERFLLAIEKNDTEKVQKLLLKGVDPNYKTADTTWPIVNASWSGNAKIVSLLLENGANVNAQNKFGMSGLHWAAEKGHTDVARVLVDAKINIDLVNKEYGNTALILAALNGQYEIVKILIKAGADINYKNFAGNSALFVIDKNNIPEILHLLIDNGANINDTNNEGWTALHYYSRDNQEKAVRILLDLKAGINIISKNGWTPLLLSVYNNNNSITKLLLDNKADVKAVNKEGQTALHIAILNGNAKLVSLLLEHGADFYKRENTNNNGKLLIDIAYNSKSSTIKKLAIKHMDKMYNAVKENDFLFINEVISGRGTIEFLQMIKTELLFRAVAENKKECIEVLLKGRAVKRLHSYEDKKKILELAVQKENIKLAKILVSEFEELHPDALSLAEDNKIKDLHEYTIKVQKQKELDRKRFEKEREMTQKLNEPGQIRLAKEKKRQSDREMIQALKDLCHAYAINDSVYLKLEPKVKEIGEKLNKAGGITEMRRIFSYVKGTPGSRTLEMLWNGIGSWRG